jgi:hypothetical protein
MSSRPFGDRWAAASLDVTPLSPADRHAVVDCIRVIYRAAGRVGPNRVIWVRSPVELASANAKKARIHRAHRRATRRSGLARWGREPIAIAWLVIRYGLLFLLIVALAGAVFYPFRNVDDPPPEWDRHPLGPFLLFLAALFLDIVLCLAALVVLLLLVEKLLERYSEQLEDIGMDLALAAAARWQPKFGSGPENGTGKPWPGLESFWETFWKYHLWVWREQVGWLDPVFHREGFPAARSTGLVTLSALGAGAQQLEEGTLDLGEEGRAVLRAALGVRRAFGWTPFHGLVFICEPPREMHVEWVGDRPRLHSDTGPAVVWADDRVTCDFYLHGVRVPAHLFSSEVNVAQINAESNSEVRRVVIERFGWARYLALCQFRLIASVPDPGNRRHHLALYEFPSSRSGADRMLVMVNGSPDRSGRQREYAELVPGRFDDPVEAAAWQYDCPVEVYRNLNRRT